MFDFFWNDLLYRPLLNALVWLYNNWASENLGWAVIILTVGLRIVLLPFSIITERNAVRYERLKVRIDDLHKSFKNDPVLLKEEVRKVMRMYRVSPWAKTLVLAIQGLVLVLLYQVFLAGMGGGKIMSLLYGWNDLPGIINTVFFTYDIAERSVLWAFIVAVWLFLDLYISQRKSLDGITKGEAIFVITFPLAIFFVLWWLPMVKSLFILTSMMFSATITILRRMLVRVPGKDKKNKKGILEFIYVTIMGA